MLYNPKWERTKQSDVASAILRGRALIEREECWSSCGVGDDHKRCAIVALAHANPHNYQHAVQFLGLAMGKGEKVSIGEWNDSHSHAEVLAAFDQAYELAIRHY